MAWKSAIRLPKASRSFAYASASSRQARAMPTACAAMLIRPPSSVVRAILKPSPTAPMSLELADAEPLRAFFDDERRDALVLQGRVRLREDDRDIRDRAVGDEVLRPI